MLAFDTSSIIYAWDNYPLEMFPPLWHWLGNEISSQNVIFPEVTKQEIINNSPECAVWVNGFEPNYLATSPRILDKAFQIKGQLGIVEDKYGAGVGEKDLIIIATAHVNRIMLVSNEKKQPKLPEKKHNYKIPAVCTLPGVAVTCINFLEYLKNINRVFQS